MRTVLFTAHNRLSILHSGGEYFPALIEAIDAARVEIYLETYIFSLDDVGTVVRDALKRAASRGISVHVITDWLGTGHVRGKMLADDLVSAGVEHHSFNPWFRHGIARTHRKICVVDGTVAFVGGINIISDYRNDDPDHDELIAPRWDFAVRAEGPLVAHVQRIMQLQWLRTGRLGLISRIQRLREGRIRPGRVVENSGMAGFVVRDNLRNRRTIQRSYQRALGLSRHSVYIANPYFAPALRFCRALAHAVERGVDVSILIGVGEFRVQDAVAQSFYRRLLSKGIRLYEYRKTQLHAKVAVIDDDWATIGSSNVDGISLFINQEANVVVRDAAFARDLRTSIEAAIAESVEIRLEDFASRPWYKRWLYDAVFVVYRGLMRIVTLGDYT
ncbi:MAG: cardiolipin synthase B [Desulfobulbaceae bacterium]|nr:MAG: cardiolipin synthase B [Desulfobulbaceae bacterium]